MAIIAFPPLEFADDNGLLAVGGDLEVESLLLAYRNGIFPWPISERQLTWFAPPHRTVLFLDELHISRSLRKELKRPAYEFKIDHDFSSVIQACAEVKNRGTQRGTWITQEMIAGFTRFHHAGYAHSIECYEHAELIGGLYGVAIAGFFGGESMFYRKENGSKLALCHLVEHLKKCGIKWIDCQVSNLFLESMGAREISRDKFMSMLNESLSQNVKLFAPE